MNTSICISTNIENDWGFFVDLESSKQIVVISDNQYYKIDNSHYINDYYNEVYNEAFVELYDNNSSLTHNKFGDYIIRVSSTTIFTAILTYAIFFLL
jgi:hypothetical protein